MAFTVGTMYGKGADGWSTYGAPIDVNYVYYVADAGSGGSDANTGTMVGGVISPVLTLSKANTLLQNAAGAGHTPWLLFKEGCQWTDQYLTDTWVAKGSGTVVTPCNGIDNLSQPNLNPIVISSYDPSVVDGSGTFCTPNPSVAARPKFNMNFNTTFSFWLQASLNNLDKVVFSGLEWYYYKHDPNNANYTSVNSSGSNSPFSFTGASESFILWEDCKCSFAERFFGIQNLGDYISRGFGVIARRNIIVDTFPTGDVWESKGTQGVYAEGSDVHLIENTFDMISWWPETQPGPALAAARQITVTNDGSGNALVTWPDKYGPGSGLAITGTTKPSFFCFSNSNVVGSPATAGSTVGTLITGDSYRAWSTGDYKNYLVNSATGSASPYTFTFTDGSLIVGQHLTITAAGSGGTPGTYNGISTFSGLTPYATVNVTVNASGQVSDVVVATTGTYITPSVVNVDNTTTGVPSGAQFAIKNTDLKNVPYNAAMVSPQYAYWTDVRGNEFGHPYYWNVYGNGVYIQGNFISRTAAGGKSLGVQIRDNAWIANGWSTNMYNEGPGNTYYWQYNVVMASEDHSKFAGGNANLCDMLNQASISPGANVNWMNNIYAHSNSTGTDGYSIHDAADNVFIDYEIIFSWGTSSGAITTNDHGATYGTNNDFDVLAGNAKGYSDPWRTAGSYYANLFPASPNATFTGVIDGSGILTVSGISGTINEGDAITFTGQTKAAKIKKFGTSATTGTGGNGTYAVGGAASVGSGSMHSFTNLQLINLARGQTKGTWNYNYTSNAFNNYIRSGFGVASYPGLAHHGGRKLSKF